MHPDIAPHMPLAQYRSSHSRGRGQNVPNSTKGAKTPPAYFTLTMDSRTGQGATCVFIWILCNLIFVLPEILIFFILDFVWSVRVTTRTRDCKAWEASLGSQEKNQIKATCGWWKIWLPTHNVHNHQRSTKLMNHEKGEWRKDGQHVQSSAPVTIQ